MSETVTALKGTELPSSKSPVHEQGLWATPVSQTLGRGRAACEGGSGAAARVAVGWVLPWGAGLCQL